MVKVASWPGDSYSSNPFVGEFCAGLRSTGLQVEDVRELGAVSRDADILQIHWPEQLLWRPSRLITLYLRVFWNLLMLVRIRCRGTKLVWLVHNLEPHELDRNKRPLWRAIRAVTSRLASGFMTLSPATIDVVRKAIPGLRRKRAAAIRHPLYRPAGSMTRADARRGFNISPEDTVFALLGNIRPYKGTRKLVSAFKAMRKEDAHLIIAGKPISSDYASELDEHVGSSGKIHLELSMLEDERFSQLTRTADCVVLPYVSYLHSGALIHALSHETPVLTPRTPFAEELAQKVGGGWIQLYDGPLTAGILESWKRPSRDICLFGFSTPSIGQNALAFYEKLSAEPVMRDRAELSA